MQEVDAAITQGITRLRWVSRCIFAKAADEFRNDMDDAEGSQVEYYAFRMWVWH